jgi:hypothetical protein
VTRLWVGASGAARLCAHAVTRRRCPTLKFTVMRRACRARETYVYIPSGHACGSSQ